MNEWSTYPKCQSNTEIKRNNAACWLTGKRAEPSRWTRLNVSFTNIYNANLYWARQMPQFMCSTMLEALRPPEPAVAWGLLAQGYSFSLILLSPPPFFLSVTCSFRVKEHSCQPTTFFKGFFSAAVVWWVFYLVLLRRRGWERRRKEKNRMPWKSKLETDRCKAECSGVYPMGASGIPEATGAGWDCSPSRGSTSGALFPWAYHCNWCPPPPRRGRGRRRQRAQSKSWGLRSKGQFLIIYKTAFKVFHCLR